MPKYFFAFILTFAALHSFAQSKYLNLSAGYALANIKSVDTNADGWRISASLEYPSKHDRVLHAVTLGHITTSATITEMSGGQPIESKYTIGTWPLYYAPKFLIGNSHLQGYVKPLAGMQFSTIKRSGTLEDASSGDAGFFTGIGLGGMIHLNADHYINLEYEWAYQSNSYYSDGFLHSITVGYGLALK